MSDFTDERLREREPEPQTVYDRWLEKDSIRLRRALSGDIVMHRDEMAIQQSRHGILRFFLNTKEDPGDPTAGSAVQDWEVFTHDIKNQSGMHRHQGGLVIYVVSGKGHTVVEDERIDWRAGDLLLLPVVPGGVAHQHFNDEEGDEPVQWVAFIFAPMRDAVGSFTEQLTEAPDFTH